MSSFLETLLIIILGIIFVTLFFLNKNIFDLIIKIVKGKNKIIKQAKDLGFKIYPQHDFDQFNKNIYQSDFLKNLFGNWKTLHGQIILTKLSGTIKYKNYQIELIHFFIKPLNKKDNLSFGPFTGLHFNLKKHHSNVNIIYKKDNWPNKIVEILTNNRTIKPKTWETESNTFNKYYAILSNDNLMNLRVLTPDVMAKILDSKLKINIEINNNHLLIYTASKLKINNELKNMLEIGWRIAENLE